MTALRTARLLGRPIRASDGDFAAELFGREQVGRFVAESRRVWTAELAHERARAFAAHWPAHGFGLRLWETASPETEGAPPFPHAAPPLPHAEGRPAGVAGLQFCVLEGRGAVEVSFAFLPEYWGRGLAREAMEAVLVEAAEVCRELEAVAHGDNHRAAALLIRLGFEPAAGPGSGPGAARVGAALGGAVSVSSASAPAMRRYRRRVGG